MKPTSNYKKRGTQVLECVRCKRQWKTYNGNTMRLCHPCADKQSRITMKREREQELNAAQIEIAMNQIIRDELRMPWERQRG